MDIKELFMHCLRSLDLPDKEIVFLADALVEATETRIGELKAAVATAQLQSEDFAAKYQMDYAQFKHQFRGNSDTNQEDFVAWGFWEKINANRSATLAKYENLKKTSRNC